MLRKLRPRELVILDRVYEHVTLPPLITAAVDTPIVQRLRSLKQLGASSFLYPGAVHTRFEHSIGVSHMARTVLSSFQRRQPELGICEDDILFVMLAGLLHDVGHGPFSHLFEDVISKRCGVDFHHEEMSEKLARRVLSNLLPPGKVDVVVSLMKGCAPHIPYGELISNKCNGIDVDRLDYFCRDSLCCFGKPTVDVRVNRLAHSARLVCDGGKWQLAFEAKMALSLQELFTLRAKLHKNVYQHQVTKAIGHMIGDIIHAAVPYFSLGGHSLIDCARNEELFVKLGDWILEAIEVSNDAHLRPAQVLIKRLRERDIYRTVCAIALNPHQSDRLRQEDWHQRLLEHAHPSHPLSGSDFITEVVVIHQGKGSEDPLQDILFYNPKKPSQPFFRLNQSRSLGQCSPLFSPQVFEERTLMVFERYPTNGALQRACQRLMEDRESTPFLMDSLPFHNQQ